MQFSQDTEAILSYLDSYAVHGLRKRNDLGVLLEVGAKTGSAKEFNDLVFTGKSVWNLFATLKKAGAGGNTDALQREFALHVNAMREQLLPFVAHVDDEVRDRFSTVYLGTGDGTLRNLVDLAYDLAQVKDVQADQRRGPDETPM